MGLLRVLCVTVLSMATVCPGRTWDVRELGAKGDKESNDAAAIQAVIDKCAEASGGTVYVPAGDYRCGQLRLRSHVALHLEAGATLWVSSDKADYKQGSRFLIAEGQSGITIQGRGTIHGTGRDDLQRKRGDTRPRPEFRVGILEFLGCKDVTIRDVTVRHSDSWTFDLERCENVVIDGLTVDGLRVFIPTDIFAKYPRSALSVHSVRDADIRNVQRRPAGAESDVPVIVLEDVQRVR